MEVVNNRRRMSLERSFRTMQWEQLCEEHNSKYIPEGSVTRYWVSYTGEVISIVLRYLVLYTMHRKHGRLSALRRSSRTRGVH